MHLQPQNYKTNHKSDNTHNCIQRMFDFTFNDTRTVKSDQKSLRSYRNCFL